MKPLIVSVLFFAISIMVLPCFSQTKYGKEISKYMDEFTKNREVFSGVVLAAKNGKVVYNKAFGFANAEFNVKNEIHTRFLIGSITKYFTVVIANQLFDHGVLKRTDKISKFIDHFPKSDSITVEMLLFHRAGLMHRLTTYGEEAFPISLDSMVEKARKSTLLFSPGSSRLYSSAGYAIISYILEKASGVSYEELLQKYVFEPAGMINSADFKSERIEKRLAKDYYLGPIGYQNAALMDYSFLRGGGSSISTVDDLYKFLNAVISMKFGKGAYDDLVVRGALAGSGKTNGHFAYIKTDTNSSIVILTNLMSGVNEIVIQGLDSILHNKTPRHVKFYTDKSITPAPGNLRDYNGNYRSNLGTIRLNAVDSNLVSQGIYKYYYLGNDKFYDYTSDTEIIFNRNNQNGLTSITLITPLYTSVWQKQVP